MTDVSSLFNSSSIWIIILIALAIIVCIFVRTPEDDTSKDIVKNRVKTYVQKGFYEKLDKDDISVAIDQLRNKAKEAKRIIHNFPDFPRIWLIPPDNKGSYASKGERCCMEFMHLLFPGYVFTKVKPKWLRNPKTGRCLELDGFCPELMLALEYNGIQHYRWPNYFHKTREEFTAQRERDQIKVEKCIENNICLIRISYEVPFARIPLAIYAKLLEAVPGIKF